MQVLYYSTEFFAAAGVKHGNMATVVVGLTLVTFSVLAVSATYIKMASLCFIMQINLFPGIPDRDSRQTHPHAIWYRRNGCLLYYSHKHVLL